MTIPNSLELAYAQWLTLDEQARERAVILARAYYAGDHYVHLTARMKRILGTEAKFNLNIVRVILSAVSELLIIDRFESGNEQLDQWANHIWRINRMDELQTDVHEGVLSDGEFFIIVDWDAERGIPRFSIHPRYTDPTITVEGTNLCGDGFGCRAYYQNDDDSQPLLYVSKRWTEYLGDGRARQRRTDYYPDRIEKYAAQGGMWIPIEEDGASVIPWVDRSGKPLGIPVVHFRNPGMRPEAWDAICIQQLIDKTLLDMMMACDATAFRIFVALGFIPTTDNQPPRKNARGEIENALDIEPGQVIGTLRSPGEASFSAIDPAPLTPFLDVIDHAIQWAAMVTSTPLSRFQLTRQVASSESQKESVSPLYAKVRNRQVRFGNAWSDCFDIARKLSNVFGGASLDENLPIKPVWYPLEPRNVLQELDERAKFWSIVASTVSQTAGEISAEVVLRDLGWTDEQIAASHIRERVTEDVIPTTEQ